MRCCIYTTETCRICIQGSILATSTNDLLNDKLGACAWCFTLVDPGLFLCIQSGIALNTARDAPRISCLNNLAKFAHFVDILEHR